MRTILKAHKLLIASAAGLGLILCAHGLLRFRATGAGGDLALAAGGVVAAVACGLYYRTIGRRYGGGAEGPGEGAGR